MNNEILTETGTDEMAVRQLEMAVTIAKGEARAQKWLDLSAKAMKDGDPEFACEMAKSAVRELDAVAPLRRHMKQVASW
jgi:hypothetical protein